MPATDRSDVEQARDSGFVLRLLGPLELVRGTERPNLGSVKQRALLAILLCRVGMVVSTDELVDVLWPDRTPATAVKNLQVYASGLRAALRTVGCAVRHQPPGYQLLLGPATLDLVEFDALAKQGRASLRAGEPVRARRFLRAALRLWRGQPLAEFTHSPILKQEAHRLAAQRLAAFENLVEAELAVGSAMDSFDEIEALSRLHPTRERLRSLQMLALHRAGRRADALSVFDEVRQELAGEFGLSPSPALCRLYEDILADDGPSAGDLGGRVAPRWRPYWLPRDISDFTGRRRQASDLLRVLGARSAAAGPVVAVLHGLPGAGKTALAVHVAHRLEAAYPDGRIAISLRDPGGKARPATELLLELLRRLEPAVDGRGGLVPAPRQDIAARVSSLLADLRVLLILDDAPDLASIRFLLPGTGRSAALVTSRRLLAVDSAHFVHLEPLAGHDAVALLGRIVGSARVVADPEGAERVVHAAGLLPMPIRVAGMRLLARPDVPLRPPAAGMSDVDGRPADPGLRMVAAAILADLAADERMVLSRLAAASNRWTGLRAFGGCPDDLEAVLERLIWAHVVTERAGDGQHPDPRYRIAELLRPDLPGFLSGERGSDDLKTWSRRYRTVCA